MLVLVQLILNGNLLFKIASQNPTQFGVKFSGIFRKTYSFYYMVSSNFDIWYLVFLTHKIIINSQFMIYFYIRVWVEGLDMVRYCFQEPINIIE